MSNLDRFASPTRQEDYGNWDRCGITVREQTCIALRVPQSGDPELDAMIRTAQRRDFAAMAMQGFLAGEFGDYSNVDKTPDVARWSVSQADALLAALEPKP